MCHSTRSVFSEGCKRDTRNLDNCTTAGQFYKSFQDKKTKMSTADYEAVSDFVSYFPIE